MFLSVDHIDNTGAQDRRLNGGSSLYRRLKRMGFPKDNFQLLCWNCNSGKRLNGGICPHAG